MRRLLSMVLVALALAMFAPVGAGATSNPIFGNAKVQKLDNKSMETIVGQNSTSAYYAYLGAYYSGLAIQYGSYGAYLELFSGYQSARSTYYYYAQAYAYYAYVYYYYAYAYN